MSKFPSGNFPKVRLALFGAAAQAAMGAKRCGQDELGGRGPRLEQAWGPSATARTALGSCWLGNCPFKKISLCKIPLGSCPLGKNHLGKYITSIQNPLVFYLSYNEEHTTCCFLHEMFDLGFLRFATEKSSKFTKLNLFY